MEEQFIKSVRKNGSSLAVNIPKEIVQLLNIQEEDLVRIRIEKIQKGEVKK